MKKVLLILGAVLLGTMIAIGGCKVQGKSQKEQMLEIVKSEEVKKIIEETLKNEDSKALTNEGVIKSYQIDEKSIKHNPMGGIMFRIFLNSDEKLVVYYTLQKDSRTGKIEYSGGGIRRKLVN